MIKNLQPDYYEGVREFEVIADIEDKLFEEIYLQVDKVKNNQWIQTADIKTIAMHEKIFDIIANPEIETIQFRRKRLLNRLQSFPPFTFRYLKSRLDKILGEKNYNLSIDVETYTLTIELSASDASWFTEIQTTVNELKPANIVYLQISSLFDFINLNETASVASVEYFKVGKSRIGRDALRNIIDEKEVFIQ